MSMKTATNMIAGMVPVLLLAVLLLAAAPVLAAEPAAMPEDRGRIDRIDYNNNEVVIDDRGFQLNSETRYYSSQGVIILGSEFTEGTFVAYSAVPGSKTLLTLWKTE